MMTSLDIELLLCFRILLAAFAGGVLGWERSRRSKAAGIRVYSLTSASSAIFMILSKYAFTDVISGDPGRVAAAAVSGMSFICLAIIYRQGNTLRGLTTATGLWSSAAIGMSFAAGEYFIGAFATLFVFVLQAVMHRLHIDNDSMVSRDVTIRMKNDVALRYQLISEIEALGAECSGRSLITHADGSISINFVMRPKKRIHFHELVDLKDKHPGDIYDVSAV